MWKRLRQAFCLHWFDAPTTYSYDAGVGAIVCFQQKQYQFTVEQRICSRCGLTDMRPVGEPVYEGWN